MYSRREVTDGVTVMNKDLYDNLQDGIDEANESIVNLDAKVEDIRLFKFPNANIIGTPTVNNGQISGFSPTSYLQFPFIVDFRNRPFTINAEITTGNDINTAQKIFDSNFGFSFGIDGTHFLVAISSDGSSWDIINTTGTFTLEPDTTYRIKIEWSGTEYKTSVSTDGGQEYTEDITVSSSLSPYPKQVFIGIRHDLTHSPFLGMINFNYCNIYISSNLVWQGMDDVGIATRMTKDMSNIVPAGETKVKELARAELQGDLDTIDTEIQNLNKVFSDITITEDLFIDDTTYEDFPFKVDIPCVGVTSDYIPIVNFDMVEATSGIFSPIAVSGEDIITIYASEKPALEIIIPSILCSKEVSE